MADFSQYSFDNVFSNSNRECDGLPGSHPVCNEQSKIIFSWAKEAPDFKLPPGKQLIGMNSVLPSQMTNLYASDEACYFHVLIRQIWAGQITHA